MRHPNHSCCKQAFTATENLRGRSLRNGDSRQLRALQRRFWISSARLTARQVTAETVRDIAMFQHLCDGNGNPRVLADVQVSVVGEARESYLVVAGYVEAKLAQAEIRAGLCPAIEDGPMITMLDLVDEFLGAYADL